MVFLLAKLVSTTSSNERLDSSIMHAGASREADINFLEVHILAGRATSHCELGDLVADTELSVPLSLFYRVPPYFGLPK